MRKNIENKKLVEQYPFLLPRNRWTGACLIDFNYSFTELDAMPVGWRIAFGEDICKEIMEELVQNECVDKYRITQIKEKYGELHWYSHGGTERIHREIVPKYEIMSRRICLQCGQPATLVSIGWIAPWCKTCANKMPHLDFVDVDEFYESAGDTNAIPHQ